jgi:hypothetical protein
VAESAVVVASENGDRILTKRYFGPKPPGGEWTAFLERETGETVIAFKVPHTGAIVYGREVYPFITGDFVVHRRGDIGRPVPCEEFETRFIVLSEHRAALAAQPGRK